MRFPSLATLSVGALLVGGCGASLPGVSTGSLFGGSNAAPAAAASVQNDPTSRALQVGTTSARAMKCGYNFDPGKLRTQFLAAEAAANPADAGKAQQVYDVAFSSVSKSVATQNESYCSAAKTRAIKEALTRHLAGDYAPTPSEPVEDEGGFFDGLGSSSPETENKLRHPPIGDN